MHIMSVRRERHPVVCHPAPAVYGKIADAFDVLFARADHDPRRPHIEYYRREGEIDCLVPINSPR